MPYVPVPSGSTSATYSDFLGGRKHLYYPPATGAVIDSETDWSFSLPMRKGYKSGTKGKKVLKPWGWWSPCRPYTRSAIAVTYRGYGEDWWPDSSGLDFLRQTYTGWPANYPTLPTNFSHSGGVCGIWGEPLGPSFNERNRLITECILKIGDRKIDVAEFLAESGKAIDHLAHTSISLIKALLALRRGNMAGVAKALGVSFKGVSSGKTQASRWLEYQYAWLPLMSDVYSAAKVAKDGLGKKPPVISATRNLSDTYPWSPIGNTGYADMEGKMRINHRCKLWYRLDDGTLYRLNQLGVINPLEVAWALVPYSFVFDWFIPVGNVLEAWSATMGLTYVDGEITSHAEGTASGRHKAAASGHSENRKVRGNWYIEQKGIYRQVVSSATPSLYFKSPFSTTHVVSALALLRQLRK